MSVSIKALSTENPPVRYLGYTDHLLCFAKDFVKKFIRKYPDIPETTMQSIDPWTLAEVNGLWAAVVTWDSDESPHAGVVSAKSKKQLEEALQECMVKNSGLEILGIFSKGVKMPYETRVSIHIVEETK